MDSGGGKARINVEGDDRLSSLPDDLIHKILSFIDIKHAVQTSALSSRWRSIWTSMPYLNFSTEHFLNGYVPDSNKFSEFVTHVLSHRNNQIDVLSLNLKLARSDLVSRGFLTEILDYAFSHNIQQLAVSCLFYLKVKIPLDLFRSQTLKHLMLTGPTEDFSGYSSKLALTWNLPALTTLHLDHVKFCDEDTCLFSKCTNLKSLTLNHFRLKKSSKYGLSICHSQISSITLKNRQPDLKVVNVVAPKLQSLRIIDCYGQHRVSAPNLVTLVFKGDLPLQFSNDNLCCLEKVDFCSYYPNLYGARELVGLLQRVHNVRFLALNSELVELLSASMNPSSLQASPFANLKSLKIYPGRSFTEEGDKSLTISTELKNYLLGGSPSATLTIDLFKEIYDSVVENHMEKSWEILYDTRKELMESFEEKNHEQANAQVNNQRAQPLEKMHLKMCEKMERINLCWVYLGLQIDRGRETTYHITPAALQDIEASLLTELPASNRNKLQACFSSLHAEVEIVVKKIIDGMQIQCVKKERNLSNCLPELDTTPQPSS